MMSMREYKNISIEAWRSVRFRPHGITENSLPCRVYMVGLRVISVQTDTALHSVSTICTEAQHLLALDDVAAASMKLSSE